MGEVGIDFFPDIAHGDVGGRMIGDEAQGGSDDKVAPWANGGIADEMTGTGGMGFDVKSLQCPPERPHVAVRDEAGIAPVPRKE